MPMPPGGTEPDVLPVTAKVPDSRRKARRGGDSRPWPDCDPNPSFGLGRKNDDDRQA